MKKWQCTVCGYIHEGNEPPDICPVCGADKSQFIEITETEEKPAADNTNSTQDAQPESPESRTTATEKPAPSLFSYKSLTHLMITNHLHPITVHFPNGVIPVAVAFIFLAVIFQFAGLAKASFYNMVFVLLTLPVVLFTGYNEWKQKYQGAMTNIFMIKIISALVVTVTAVIIVLWHLIAHESPEASSGSRAVFLLLHSIMLAATGIAGHVGGKLVFKD